MSRKLRTAILISGRGTNMAALIEAAKAPDYPVDVALVISNRPEALGLEKARAEGITALAIDHKDFKTREAFETELHAELIHANIELVACAGFMRIMTASFTNKWTGRMLNIHPSLLPKYKGLHTHERAIEAGDKVHGATVHYVSGELDSGVIVAQTEIDILPNEKPDSLAARLLPLENALYVDALETVANKIIA